MAPAPNPGPGYWMHETSGVLAPAVTAYLEGGALTLKQIGIMRAYLRQWIMWPYWQAPWQMAAGVQEPGDPDPELVALRERVDTITSRRDIDVWCEAALGLGLDPL